MARIEVRYNECDITGYAYNANFFVWMSIAALEFMKTKLDTDALTRAYITPMMVHQSCDYKSPVTYGDVVDIKPKLVNLGESSFTTQYDMYKDNKLVAIGKTVYCFMDLKKKVKAAIPPDIRDMLNGLLDDSDT